MTEKTYPIKLNSDEVRGYLPHRDPFIFVDEIESLSPGKNDKNEIIPEGTEIIGKRLVREDEYYFKGHFPGNPMMPGVLQIETMAQVSIFASMPFLKDKNSQIEVALVFMDKTKFRRPVKPNDLLIVSSKCVKKRGKFWVFECSLSVGESVVCEAELTAAFEEKIEIK